MSKSHLSDLNPEWCGKRIRRRRLELGLSAQELADLAHTSRQTIVRLEAGQPSKKATFTRVIRVLRLWTDQLRRVMADDAEYVVNRRADLHWNVSIPKRMYQKYAMDDDDPIHVDDADERRRLGEVGFQPFFTSIVGVQLPGGLMEQALMELHKPSWVDNHYGEEFVYVLRGEVMMTIRDEDILLREGDSMCFVGNLPHKYSPGHPLAKGEEAPQILLVVAIRDEDKRKQWVQNYQSKMENLAEVGSGELNP